MDSLIMMFLSMLLLSTAFHGVFSCTCHEIDWKTLMCPEETGIVIQASVINAGPVNNYAVYFMHEAKLYKAKPKKFSYPVENFFTLATPINCSLPFHKYYTYIIYGNIDENGILQTNRCLAERFDNDFYDKSGREKISHILSGRFTEGCRGQG
ncbi:hypothetical protein CHS0354_022107 [Potamilus streckersoni]|uniref:MD-2-related lipid-recognition domain-containing protein n=1 Tax=Potamilus streckersoni TaxID=2493646 RepID=A0AAE0RUJ6_9BIVA|nr:hypothetical protein CHS0354_022107 [Potamilus streckersoni]